MAGNTVKEMTTNFGKLDKFEGHDFRRWQKKMHFLLTTLKVVYELTNDAGIVGRLHREAIRIQGKELWDSLESKYMAEDSSNWYFQEVLAVVVIRRMQMLVVREKGLRTIPKTKVDAIAWWIDSGATTHVCKDRCWFKTYEPVEDGSVLYMGDDHFAPVHGKGSVMLEFSLAYFETCDKGKGKEVTGPSVNMAEEGKNKNNKQNKGKKPDYKEHGIGSGSNKKPKLECWKCGKTGQIQRICVVTYEPVEDGSVLYMGDDHFAPVHGKGSVVLEFSSGKSITLFNVLYVPKLRFGYYNNGHVHYKRMLEMSKDELIPAIDENPDKCTTCMFCYVYLLHAKDEALDKFRIYKTEVELQQNDLIKSLRTDRGGEYYDPIFFQSVGIIHETTAPYTPQQNGVAERKNRALKEMVNSMLSYSGLSEGAVVRLPDPKRKTLGEKGIDCIFVGYAEHSKAYRFYVIEPNDSVSINSIIESRDAIFDENRNVILMVVPSEILEPRKGKRVRKAKSYGSDFQLYLVEGSRDQVGSQYSYCYSIEEDPRTYNEAMQSRDSAFWKEAIDDEIGSIMENNTWVLSDLPPGCKPLGCKWIFKRKINVDGTMSSKFKIDWYN
ncbi:zinc finger, CCHC-type containing protein [Tanacetum coccineum]